MGFVCHAKAGFSRILRSILADRSYTASPAVFVTTLPYEGRPKTDDPSEADNPLGDPSTEREKEEDLHTEGKSNLVKDPLRWFGILVPPALRAAQGSFTTVTVDLVPKLVQVEQQLQALEKQIREARSQVGPC